MAIFRISPVFCASFLLFCMIGSFASCNSGEKFEKRQIKIESLSGLHVLIVEIARTEAQRAQGLMHRTSLDDGAGMLFIFERDQILAFWMKDTLIPLSIAYISADGRILEIYDMEPGNLNPVVSSRSARYALEVPQGWFQRVGIRTGDRLILSGD